MARRLIALVCSAVVLGPPAAASEIDVADVERMVPIAASLLAAAGFDTAPLERLEVTVEDLPGNRIGEAAGPWVTFDVDAAGAGWFVDPTPLLNEEFGPFRLGVARAGEVDGIDLLSNVVHELGHVIGLDHGAAPFMAPVLARRARVLPIESTGYGAR